MPTPLPFFAVIRNAGYAQFPDLMEVTPLPGYMPGSPPPRPHPSPIDPNAPRPSHPIALPGDPWWGGGGPVDPGYSPPWAQVRPPVDPGYSPPWAQVPPGSGPGGPVDPGYSPPWAQVPVDPGYGIDIGSGYRPPLRPTHPIMLPGMPGWGLPPGGLHPPIILPPDAAPPTDETQIIYKYSASTGLTGPYVVAPAPAPAAPPA